MGRRELFIRCDCDTKDVIWDALYAAAEAVLHEAKRDLRMLKMTKGHPEWRDHEKSIRFWRRHLASDMDRYHRIMRCRQQWWVGLRMYRLRVNECGCPI